MLSETEDGIKRKVVGRTIWFHFGKPAANDIGLRLKFGV